jgi:integrase
MNLNQIKAAKAGDELTEDEVRGLQLRVHGERKTFYLYYRTKTGQRRRPKLGDFPAITLAQARELARELLAKVALGGDPSATWQASRNTETVSELCDRYLVDYAEERKRTAWRDKQRINNVIRPRWGTRPAVEISKEDVMGLRRAMKDIPSTFNRTRALLSCMFNFAEIEPNPVKRVPRFRETARRRYLAPDEYVRLAEALDAFEPQYPNAIAFLRLLLLLGCRSGELLRAKRAWYQDGVLTLPVHKTCEKMGAKEIIFPPSAQAVLNDLVPRNDWLCGFSTRPTYVIDLVTARAKLENFVPHDIRHSFASEALSAGYTLDQIAELFGHASIQTTRRYAHLIQAKKREAALDIALQMERRLSAKAA